jgi:O-antigen/teichoic acid export membrane protein
MKGYAYYLQRPLVTLLRKRARDIHNKRENAVLKRPKNVKDVLKYTTLIIFAGSVATMLMDLDAVMLGLLQDIDTVAYYGVAIYIATVIAVPLRAMHQITYPMVAAMLNENRREAMKDLYQKSSISLLVISGLLFLLISCNIQSLYELLNPNYNVGLYVVLLIGVAKLFDTMLGVNNAIVFNSDYYRLVLYVGVFLVVVAVVLNIILIPRYGIYGAAIATFIASLSYGMIKLIIVKQKFRIQPFTKNTAKAVALILLFFLGFYFWNLDILPLMGIVVKSIIMIVLYVVLIYKLRLSVDINGVIQKVLKKVL